jgi:16S rRNA (guanine966-N2)-methyltransferase
LRIISGIAKGTKLAAPPGKGQSIRPTSDRSREALFSILGKKVIHSRILDLFSGTGALGLEALSRGGKSAVFVDNNSTALKLLRTNIEIFSNTTVAVGNLPAAKIVRLDLSRGLGSLTKYLGGETAEFDIIFLDPPYDKGLSLQTLNHLDNSNHLANDGIIIAEERSKANLPEIFNSFKLIDNRKYGETGFWFYKS